MSKGIVAMKKKRHGAILELIKSEPISTQEELLSYLCEHGFNVTQATVSRDIKELHLVKRADGKGQYKYCVSDISEGKNSNRFDSIFSSTIISVECASNMVCIKCHVGMANAACAALDSMEWEEIIGTLAGDDTIFVMCKTAHAALNVETMIHNYLL